MAPRSILVADEDPDTRIILRALLERHGYAVAEAANAQEAMRAVKDDIALIIMNHPMMATPQITLARWMRAQTETRETPIINLTSRAVPNYVEDAARQGVTVSLVKPLDVHAILQLVRQLTTSMSVAAH
jgi:CheY-like chemotaxis protein